MPRSHASDPSAELPVPTRIEAGGFAGHPPGLTTLFLTELWERFSYYGMKALLVLFMVAPVAAGGLGFETAHAARIYGNYTMAVYLLAIPGGFLADAFLGGRRAVLVGGIVIALGHYTLAVPAVPTFYAGLALVALGTGLLKPNISALVGSLYRDGDERRDAGFSLFYLGINVGAFIAPLVTGYLAQSQGFRERLVAWGLDPTHCWHWGFGAAGVGMTLGLFVYVAQGQRLAHVGEKPARGPIPWRQLGLVAAGTLALAALAVASDVPRLQWLRLVFVAAPIGVALGFGFRRAPEARRVGAIAVFFLASMIFWAIFEQAGSTIQLFGDRLTRTEVFGVPFPSAWYQSINSLFVMLLAPLFAWLWMRLDDRQPSSPVKFALGLAFLGLSFALMVPAARLTAEGLVSPLWLVGLFFLQTVGELLLSPVGLSTMTKLAPARFVGLVMGAWFLSMSWGNKLAGILASEFSADDPAALATFFGRQALAVAACTVLAFALVPWVRSRMGGVR
jgi:POT family proton-dependent oligopeptide transporter